MTKKSSILLTVLIIALAAISVWYFFFRTQVIIENRLKANIATKVEVNMRKVTPFEWDRFYIFEPYATADHIDQTLGFKSSLTGPLYDEQQLLVFVKNDEVVSAINFPRYSPGADFLPERSFSIDEAVFILDGDNKLIKK